ncbi:uncharacterized protein HMPREF1541_07137 [Cyphellophora europaea CBS 101466]|uniref:Uncharacterized protein n=1 Tax=Cyphellophora europaea (strain CBS 101466) TaxID=1220924 RepID=W2RMH0_CYPE1|nr:uncharacterized protein HMPREF1541_07137 [Cyphellophora europaea CBS 101466]ETN37515.1 hypothetical protein HMPREF1541_07137 [Cyphellophora europaea CBS 101466]
MAFRTQFTWASSPLIVNAPMGGFAGPELAAAVSRAGGLGMVGALMDAAVLSEQLTKAASLLNAEPAVKSNSCLPIGVGLLLFALGKKKIEFLETLAKHKPAVIWLFAETALSDYTEWATDIRKLCPESQLWIQTGTVGSALQLAKDAKPDVLVMQGKDAGGHGWESGAGVISLLPEAKDALARDGYDVGVLASGGIVDARGTAAALSLGADGVVMGTRFLASKEVTAPPLYQQQILDTHDGGQYTIRAKVFDELRGPNVWPAAYDGRAIVSKSYEDYANGVGIDQIRKRHSQALESDDKGLGASRRAVVWCGTAVGLVNEICPAADIVRELHQNVRVILDETKARL